MDEDFDDIIDELTGDDPDEHAPAPIWRATIRRGRLMLTGWAPFLVTNGPLGSLLPGRARAGVTIADLTVHGADSDEVSVSYLARAEPAEEAREVLLEWSQRVGFRRVWLPDCIVVELEPDPEQLTAVSVRCEVCRARWTDGTPDFWLTVREGKAFPRICPLCGCEMPQWVGEPDHTRKPGSSGRAARWTASESRPRQRQDKR